MCSFLSHAASFHQVLWKSPSQTKQEKKHTNQQKKTGSQKLTYIWSNIYHHLLGSHQIFHFCWICKTLHFCLCRGSHGQEKIYISSNCVVEQEVVHCKSSKCMWALNPHWLFIILMEAVHPLCLEPSAYRVICTVTVFVWMPVRNSAE